MNPQGGDRESIVRADARRRSDVAHQPPSEPFFNSLLEPAGRSPVDTIDMDRVLVSEPLTKRATRHRHGAGLREPRSRGVSNARDVDRTGTSFPSRAGEHVEFPTKKFCHGADGPAGACA